MKQIFCSGECGASITVQADDASNIPYTCARCAPQHKADAVGVPYKSVPKEVREEIKRSLAPAANDIPREHKIAVETSSGTKEVTLLHEDDDITADDLETDKVKRVATPSPSDKKPHNPFGPQSLSHAGVYNPKNKNAPYGYDDEGRPVRVIKTNRVDEMFRGCTPAAIPPTPEETERRRKRELEREEERAKREQELAAEREREWNEKLERLTHLPEFAGMKGAPSSRPKLSGFGAERRDVLPLIPVGASFSRILEERPRPRPYYLELLGMSRQQLVELLNVSVGTVTHTFEDVTKPKTKRIKSKTPVEVELRWLSGRAEELKGEVKNSDVLIAKVDAKIAEQESVRHGLKKPVMKRERDPDNIPDDAYLKKLRREVDDKIAELNAQRDALVGQQKKKKEEIKSIPSLIQAQQARLESWDTTPENIIEEYPRSTVVLPVLFSEMFAAPKEDNFRGRVPEGYTYNDDACGAYYQLVYEFGDKDEAFRYWRRFENAVIVQAIERRLLPLPSEEVLRKFRSEDCYRLTRTKPLDPVAEGDHDEDVDVDRSAEEDVINKTSGAAIGGSIRGGGTSWAGKARSLSSFDRSIAFGGGREGGGGGGDDHTEPQGSDDDESMTPS